MLVVVLEVLSVFPETVTRDDAPKKNKKTWTVNGKSNLCDFDELTL